MIYADHIFLWGVHQQNLLKKNITNKSQISVSGHPRFELLNKKYSYLYKSNVESIKKQHNNFILINTNMGFGNNIRGDEFVKTNYLSRIPNISKVIEFDKLKRDTIIELSIMLSKHHNIIIRPHPEEDEVYYKNIFAKYDNINIDKSGSVIPWIIASDIMIHPDCTTSIESLLLGKKAISILPNNYNPDLVTQLPLKVSWEYDTVGEVVSFINNKLYIDNIINYDDYSFLEEYFSISKKSSELIVDKICEFKDDRSKVNNPTISKYYYAIKNKIKKKSKLINDKLQGFQYEKLLSIQKTFNNSKKVKIKNNYNDLFIFTS